MINPIAFSFDLPHPMSMLIEFITSKVTPEPVRITHDWTVSIGDGRFGVCELDWSDGGTKPTGDPSQTSIHLGPIDVDTDLPAAGVLGIGIILLLVVIAFGIFGTRARRSPM